MTARLEKTNPRLLFVALAAGINILVVWLAGHFGPKVALGAVLDMTITVPALYYTLIVRRGLASHLSLGLIALLSLWRASFAFPAVVPGRFWIGVAVEVLFLSAAVIAFRTVRASAESDPVLRIEAAMRRVLPAPGAERFLAGELAVLYYGLNWRAKPDVGPDQASFTLHRRSGFQDILFFVGLGSLLEIVPMHLILHSWILTGLSLYGAFWAVAVARSFELRPCTLSGDALLLRFGLLAQMRIPFADIEAVTTDIPAGAAVLPRRETPEIYIRFRRPLELTRLPGRRRAIPGIALSTDQPLRWIESDSKLSL